MSNELTDDDMDDIAQPQRDRAADLQDVHGLPMLTPRIVSSTYQARTCPGFP